MSGFGTGRTKELLTYGHIISQQGEMERHKILFCIFEIYRVVWLGTVSGPTLNFWYHICMDIDTIGGSMNTAINGKVVSEGVKLGEGVAEQMTAKMQGKLVVGKWNYTYTGKKIEQVHNSIRLQNLCAFNQ